MGNSLSQVKNITLNHYAIECKSTVDVYFIRWIITVIDIKCSDCIVNRSRHSAMYVIISLSYNYNKMYIPIFLPSGRVSLLSTGAAD